jgi:uncharacterized membrane protein YfcA
MYFPISGVEVSPLVPIIAAFVIATICAGAGVSGALLLLPFQMLVLGFTAPAVSPTNLFYSIIGIPGGLYRFIKDRRMTWPLFWGIVIGTLPGTVLGAWIRVEFLPDPQVFKFFVGLVLLYLGGRILYHLSGKGTKATKQNKALNEKFQTRIKQLKTAGKSRMAEGLPAEAVIVTKTFSFDKIEYTFWGETFSINTKSIIAMTFIIGVIGGAYGSGGGAIGAPFLVSVVGLPVYTIAAATLAGTFVASVVGVTAFSILGVYPDWMLGLFLGIGGFAGTYCGAYLQKYLPERLIRGILGLLVMVLAGRFIWGFFS